MKRMLCAVLLLTVTLAGQEASALPLRRATKTRPHVDHRAASRPMVREMYPGYEHGFPPPAMLYYGYPRSGHSYGIGF